MNRQNRIVSCNVHQCIDSVLLAQVHLREDPQLPLGQPYVLSATSCMNAAVSCESFVFSRMHWKACLKILYFFVEFKLSKFYS